ncbi:hypothetical protein DYQ86_13695 [Acidobacteria bacterium AB60]|nr:hypothetical protein DYQ86_13695 [Acidobacteria bacterium AB60]
MAESARETKQQEEFRNAGNANVIQQAAEGPEAQNAPRIVPGQRLTGAEAEAEISKPSAEPAQKSAADGNYDPARGRDAASEALKVQHPGDAAEDTDSDLPSGDQIRARAEGTAMVNPD